MRATTLAREPTTAPAIPERDLVVRVIDSALQAIKAPYPRKRLVRRCPGRVQSRGYRSSTPEELAEERRDFNHNFVSALVFFFYDEPISELSWMVAGLGIDKSAIREKVTDLLEQRRYAEQYVKRRVSLKMPRRRAQLLEQLCLPERYIAHWRTMKRRMNFPPAFDSPRYRTSTNEVVGRNPRHARVPYQSAIS